MLSRQRDTDFRESLAKLQALGRGLGRTYLHVDLTGLMSALGIPDKAKFAKLSGLERGFVAKLEDDNWQEITPDQLLTLLNLEAEARRSSGNANFRVFESRPSPLFETFGDTPAHGFVGRDLKGNRVDTDFAILSILLQAGIQFAERRRQIHTPEAMRTNNCIFLGSPKCNERTAEAMDYLWPSGPPPIKFLWPDCAEQRLSERFVGRGELGIEFLNHEGELDRETETSRKFPVGVLVVCRSPNTPSPVTSIIAAGSSRFGTLEVVKSLLYGFSQSGSAPLQPGIPMVYVLRGSGSRKRWYSVAGKQNLDAKHRARRIQSRLGLKGG